MASPSAPLRPQPWQFPATPSPTIPHGTKHVAEDLSDDEHAEKRRRRDAGSPGLRGNPFELRPLKRTLEDLVEDGPTKKVKTDFGDDGRGIPRDPPEEFLGETEDEAPMTVDEGVDTVSSPPASSGAPQSTALILYSPPPTKTPSVGPLDPVTGLPSLPNRVLLTPLPLPIPIKVPKEPEVDWRSGQLVLWKPKEDVVLKALEADGRDTATSDGDAAEMDLD